MQRCGRCKRSLNDSLFWSTKKNKYMKSCNRCLVSKVNVAHFAKMQEKDAQDNFNRFVDEILETIY